MKPLDGFQRCGVNGDVFHLGNEVEGVTTVEILGPANSVLGRVVAQAGQPVVTMTAPTSGQIITGDTLDVAWTAADPDGEALFFNLHYSVDQGQSWETVARNLTEQHLTLELRYLRRGQDLRFRVWASDGIHTSYAEMPAGVALPNGSITAKIGAPVPKSTCASCPGSHSMRRKRSGRTWPMRRTNLRRLS